jgi:hypothetical protein
MMTSRDDMQRVMQMQEEEVTRHVQHAMQHPVVVATALILEP